MPFLTQGKTNWKFLLIVAVLVIIVGGVILWCDFKQTSWQPTVFNRISNFCNIDDDCGSSCGCGCGCINVNEHCPGDELAECDGYPCKCADNKCVLHDVVTGCLEKYPAELFEGCIPGEIMDGWTGICIYPEHAIDTSGIEHHIDAPAPDIVKEASIAHYSTSWSTCQTNWFIKINGEWKGVNQLDFCNYLIRVSSFLLEWEEGCC